MPTKKTRRRQRKKRLRFQIKSALISNHDPFSYFQKLAQLLNQNKSADSTHKRVYTLEKLEINLMFPNYKDIRKVNPRKVKSIHVDSPISFVIFLTGFKIILANNYPILSSEHS